MQAVIVIEIVLLLLFKILIFLLFCDKVIALYYYNLAQLRVLAPKQNQSLHRF